MHTDRQIDLTQIVVAFRSAANLPIMIFLCLCFSVFWSAELTDNSTKHEIYHPKFAGIYSRCGNSFGRGFQCSANPRSKVFSLHYSLKRKKKVQHYIITMLCPCMHFRSNWGIWNLAKTSDIGYQPEAIVSNFLQLVTTRRTRDLVRRERRWQHWLQIPM